MVRRLEGKTAIVFGAGSSGPGFGNGKAAAVTFAREGARVVAVDIIEAAAEETAGIIRAEGGQALALPADVTDLASVEEAIALALAEYHRLDILHNNVGVTMNGGPPDLSEDEFRRALDVNLGSVYRTTKCLLPHFLARGSGVIINIASIAAIRWLGYPFFAYYTTKAAVVQATVALALQYAPHGIRANAILPGFIDTPLIYRQIAGNYSSIEEMRASRSRAVPMGHMGTAFDVAHAAAFLASDEARFITGVALPVDGGQSLAVPMG